VVYLQFYDSDELIGGLASCCRQAAFSQRSVHSHLWDDTFWSLQPDF